MSTDRKGRGTTTSHSTHYLPPHQPQIVHISAPIYVTWKITKIFELISSSTYSHPFDQKFDLKTVDEKEQGDLLHTLVLLAFPCFLSRVLQHLFQCFLTADTSRVSIDAVQYSERIMFHEEHEMIKYMHEYVWSIYIFCGRFLLLMGMNLNRYFKNM